MADGGSAIPPRRTESGTRPGLRCARPKRAEENPQKFAREQLLGAWLDRWLRSNRISRDEFAECSGISATYLGKAIANEVPLQAVWFCSLPKRHRKAAFYALAEVDFDEQMPVDDSLRSA